MAPIDMILTFLLPTSIAGAGFLYKKNVNKLEQLKNQIHTKITAAEARQLIQDQQEPIKVLLNEIKEDIKELKDDVKNIKR